MSTVKISQLPEITHLNTNTDDTIIVGVDNLTTTTGKISITTLGEGLYSNQPLKVGLNQVQGQNVIAQFTGNSVTYLQTIVQNFKPEGSADIVAMTSDSDNITRFVDLGVNGADFADPLYSAMDPYDAYMFNVGYQADSQKGNLVIGTGSTDADIVLIAGGTESSNIVGRINRNAYNFYKDLVITGNTSVTGHYTFADASVQTVAAAPANYTQSAFDSANTAAANTIYQTGVNASQNTSITEVNQYAAGAYATANTNANNIVLVNQFAGGAYAKANAALANTSGTFQGNLNINGYISLNTAGGIYQETASPSVMVANTTGSFAIVTKRGSTPYTWSFGENGTLTTPGNVNISGNTNMSSHVSVIKSNFDANIPLFTINASDSGTTVMPSNSHYMLHITGKSNTYTRFVMDSYGANTLPVIVGRGARGSSDAPLATANNDVLMRIVGDGYTGTQFPSSAPTKIDFVATENFSDTNRGTEIQFWNTTKGSNTLNKIATFNANEVIFDGSVVPSKGFVYTPTIYPNAQTAITLDFANNSMIRAQTSTGLVVTVAGHKVGKVVEMWITNTAGTNQNFTHGCSAINSTTNSLTYAIPATSTIFAKYWCMDGTTANTFVAVTHT